MANDTILSSAVGTGDRIRDFDDGTRKWPASFIAFGAVSDPGPISAPTVVSSSAGLPVAQQGSWSVSVTGTVTIASNSSVNLAQVAGTTTDANSGLKSAGTLRVVLATDQPQLTNKLLVTPDSVALPAHQSVNVDQWNGTTVDTNSGNKSAGTLRVVIATDQPQLGNALKVDPSGVTSPVSGTVTATQGTAAALAGAWPVKVTDGTNTMPTGDTSGRSIHTTVDNATLAVTQSGTWTVTQGSPPWLSRLTDGANPVSKTFDLDTSGTTHEWNAGVALRISASGGSVEAKGQKAMASSIPVAIASDQSAVAVSGTVTSNQGGAPWTINVTQWNGTTVDTNSGNKSAGTLRVVLATDQPQLTNALKVDPSGVTSPVSGTVTANQGTAAGLGSAWPIKLTDGTNTMPTGDAAARPLYVTSVPVTSGGLSTYRVLWPGNTTGVNVKGSAGQVYGWYLYNNASAIRVVKLYDKATAPTTGTDAPTQTIVLPANGGANSFSMNGIVFANGIGLAVTTGIADNDTTAPTANDVVVNLFYK